MATSYPSVTETSGEQGLPTEVRVHGIGDHDLLSALGRPEQLTVHDPTTPSVVTKPRLPGHRLLLLNWSRASRSMAGWLWYVALPFTLVNVAAVMRPTRPARVVVVLAGLALTVGLTAWVMAITEQALVWLDPDWFARHRTVLVCLAPLAVAAGIARRTQTRVEGGWRIASVAHLAAVGATVAFAATQPAQSAGESFWTFRSFVTSTGATEAQVAQLDATGQEPARARLVTTLDPVAALTWGTTIVVVVLAIVLLLGMLRGARAPRAGAALALLLGVLLLNLIGAALATGVNETLRFLAQRGFPLLGPEPPVPDPAAVVLPRSGVSFGYLTLPLFGVAVLAVLGAALGAVAVVHYRHTSGAGTPRRRRALTIRGVVQHLGTSLPPVVVAVVVAAGTGLAVALYASGRRYLSLADAARVDGATVYGDASTYAWLSQVFLVLSLGFLGFLLLARVATKPRKVLGSIADVIGFWRVEAHPLAGLSYRGRVLDTLHATLVGHVGPGPTTAVCLVGHSQGSVLAAWYVVKYDGARGDVHLVTCGSPLRSLYATFFPAYFDDAFFTDLETRSASWHNFHRDTDPIAVPIHRSPTSTVDRWIDDTYDPPRAHGDYWVEPAQVTAVAGTVGA